MSAARALPFLLGLGACETIPTSPAMFCGSTDLTVNDTAPSQDVSLTGLLSQDQGETAAMSLGWSTDGQTWSVATVDGETTNLLSSKEGDAHDLTWQSATDLGTGVWNDISLRLVAYSACGVWQASTVSGLTVDNSAVAVDSCAVALKTPSSPQDGPFTIDYTLSHPSSLPAYVSPTWSDDGGASWLDMTLQAGDCDGDGVADGLTDLTTSPSGVDHCFTWDSQSDFASNESVMVNLTCGVGYDDQASDQTDAFTVNNDPAPAAGEVIFTEIMLYPSYTSGSYLELYNRSNRTINLDGTHLKRWRSSADPGTDDPYEDVRVTDPTGSLLVKSGAYTLLSESNDESDNGCVDPDLVWDSSFGLGHDTTLELTSDDVVVAELAYLDANGWSFTDGVAKGLDPSKLDSDSWSDVSSWCDQRSAITPCGDYSTSDMDKGTPNLENDACLGALP